MKKYGFTLIELVISIAIIGILSGYSVNNYTVTKEQRSLEAESKKLQEVLYLASKKASAAETGPLAQCANFQGYRVDVTIVNKQYVMRKCCEVACNSAQSTVVQTYNLPATSFTFSTPPGGTTYLFRTLSQPVLINPPANQTITIRNTAIGKCIPLTFSSVGNIRIGAKVSC